MHRLILSTIALALLLTGLEVVLRQTLFRQVSYSNSHSIDDQLKDRDASTRWRILFVGDSETRWAVNPEEIDASFRRAGIVTSSFNHAFDGFGASWWPLLLPPILKAPSLQHVTVVALGIQLIDVHQTIRPGHAPCGALQKPVLTSAFATDLELHTLCEAESWDSSLGRRLFSWMWTIRYAPAVRTLILPSSLLPREHLNYNSRKSGSAINGFEPHSSIHNDPETYGKELLRWKAQYDPSRDFQPLSPDFWPALTVRGGFFDQLLQVVKGNGRELILFAVPTNPVVIDTFSRRQDYSRNSRLLAQWAMERKVVFVDFGIQDGEDAETFFSDVRHLSGEGARTFSARLGETLVRNLPRHVLSSLTEND